MSVRDVHLLESYRNFLRRFRLWKLILGYRVWGIEAVNEALSGLTMHVPEVLVHFGATVGPGCVVHGPLIIHNAEYDYSNLRIGRRVHIGRHVLFDLTDTIVVQNEAVISMNCTLLTHQDVGERALGNRYPQYSAPLEIGTGAYLGANVIILAGCNIGSRTVVGAGSVIVKPLPDDVTAVGVPARVVKEFVPGDQLDPCLS